jgi:hypothetical protein
MRKILLAVSLVAVCAPSALAANITGESLTLRALDKVTADTRDFTVKIGDTLKYGTLDIYVAHCESRPPEESPETYAFVQISDRGLVKKTEDEEAKPKLFSGWMFGSNPALSALDHPVYDIWPLACNAPPPPPLEGDADEAEDNDEF